MMFTQPKVALIYDWVTTQYGGAEKVLLALHQAFPEAPLYTAIADPEKAPWANVFEVKTSFLQNLPGAKKWYRWLSWLMPLAFESFALQEFDIIISVTSAEAKGVITLPNQLHVCYLLTPPRYLYSHQSDYLSRVPFFIKPLVTFFLRYLQWWDSVAIHRPDLIIPISQMVANRCHNYYQLKTEPPIYPPVSQKTAANDRLPAGLPDNYYLVVSRLVTYKRLELVIQACQKLERPLVIVGNGPEKPHLKSLITKPDFIYFLDGQSDEVLATIINNCRALLMPGIEDFGITALEAQLAGKPVVVHKESGVAELLTPNKHAVFLSYLSLKAMIEAIQKVEKLKYSPKILTQNAEKYATTTFVEKFRDTITTAWHETTQGKMT